MIKDLADTLFYKEKRNEGNYSESLDWVLTQFRLFTRYKDLLKFIHHHAEYQRGIRTPESVDAMRNLLIFLETIEKVTE